MTARAGLRRPFASRDAKVARGRLPMVHPSHGLAKMDEHLRLDGPLLGFAPVQIYVLDLVRLFPIQEDDVVSNARDDL